MICPSCSSDMIVVERNSIELDHCTNCRGIWFDSGELELLLGGLGLSDSGKFFDSILAGPEPKTSEKHRKCPVCLHRMQKSSIDEQPRVLVDVCSRGDGIWFDGGELAHLLAGLSRNLLEGSQIDRRISEFLGDMFHALPATPNTQEQG